MSQEQDGRNNVEYIATSTSILKKNIIDIVDDDDDDVLNPKTTLMHSDLATITEISTDEVDDDDLTLISSLGDGSVIQNKYRAMSYRHKLVLAQQAIKECENESQSASSFSNKLDQMESQLKQLRQQQQQFSASSKKLDELEELQDGPIDYEPLDEIITPQEEQKEEIQQVQQQNKNQSEQQYHDFSNVVNSFLLQNNNYETNNKNDYYFDDSSTITSMQTKIKNKNKEQPEILFECANNLNGGNNQQLYSSFREDEVLPPSSIPISNHIQEEHIEKQQQLTKAILAKNQQEDHPKISKGNDMFVVPEEISVEKSPQQTSTNKKLKGGKRSSSSLTPTVALSSLGEDEEGDVVEMKQINKNNDNLKTEPITIDEAQELTTQPTEEEASSKSNDNLLINNESNNNNLRNSIKRSPSIKKNKRKKSIIKYTIIILIFLTVIVLSNFFTKYFFVSENDDNNNNNSSVTTPSKAGGNDETASDEVNTSPDSPPASATNTTSVDNSDGTTTTVTAEDTRERDDEES